MKIKKNDQVIVITGIHKSATPKKVLTVMKDGVKIVVEGVNQVFKHVKRGHPKNPSGGRLQMEKPIDASNVLFYCESCHKGTKLGYRFAADGSKERWCRKCGTSAGKISPARTAHAKKA
jgi:large subunit ribosomal protein L24